MITRNLTQIINIDTIYKDGIVFKSEMHTYKIKYCEIDVAPIFIQTPFSYQELEILIAYFQFRFEEILEEIGLCHFDVVPLLESFYKCKKIENGNSEGTIDLYDNWEIWAGKYDDILKLDCLNRDGLDKELEMIKRKILTENPSIKY